MTVHIALRVVNYRATENYNLLKLFSVGYFLIEKI